MSLAGLGLGAWGLKVAVWELGLKGVGLQSFVFKLLMRDSLDGIKTRGTACGSFLE